MHVVSDTEQANAQRSTKNCHPQRATCPPPSCFSSSRRSLPVEPGMLVTISSFDRLMPAWFLWYKPVQPRMRRRPCAFTRDVPKNSRGLSPQSPRPRGKCRQHDAARTDVASTRLHRTTGNTKRVSNAPFTTMISSIYSMVM
jgi:hypothetical protein